MKRIKWSLEEVVAIVDVYFRNERGEVADLNFELKRLSRNLNRRADVLGIAHDEKFRNLNGMQCIFENIKYVATDGKEGLSNVSKLHRTVIDIYHNERERFNEILNDFGQKYF